MASASARLVVGAIIVDDLISPSLVFAARRTAPEALAGLWEFPGGKVEDNESPEEALIREVQEELSATVIVGREVTHPSGAWPISEKYVMRLYFAQIVKGRLATGNSHDDFAWLTTNALSSVNWLPSDADAITTIQRYLAAWRY